MYKVFENGQNPLAILMEYEIKSTGISFKLFNLRSLR